MTEMRVMSVRQPWATLLVTPGGKNVENRRRNIAGAYRGLVAVHASLEVDYQARLPWAKQPIRREVADRLPRGAILGVVDLVDVHDRCWTGYEDRTGEVHEEWCSPWAQPDVHHLVLANPRPLAVPIPYRGALGLRHLPDDIIEQIIAAPTWSEAGAGMPAALAEEVAS